jgi:hypothetical protein
MARIITLQQLENACIEQRNLFRILFGESVEVTEELSIYHADEFDWNWAADNLLSPKAQSKYYATMDKAFNEIYYVESATTASGMAQTRIAILRGKKAAAFARLYNTDGSIDS